MKVQHDTPIQLKRVISTWLLMAIVIATIVPFNLFHSHEKEESVVQQVATFEDHNSCDHQVHLAEEQEFCFLCHFIFVPEITSPDQLTLSIQSDEYLIKHTPYYTGQYHFLAVYSVLNKGSPIS